MKIKSAFILHSLASLWRATFCVFLLMAGCARLAPGLKKGIPVTAPRGIEIHTQYAYSTEPRQGYNTFEVYIENHTADTISFTGAELNGKPLPKVQPKEISKLLTVKLGEGDEIQLTEPSFPEDCPVTWWQYYPCNEVKPGETIVFQVNFKPYNLPRQELLLKSSSTIHNQKSAIENISVTVPRFHQLDKHFTAITYSLDGKRMFVQYASRKAGIQKLQINGKTIRGLRILQSPGEDMPDLAAFDAPFDLKTGDALHVRSEFQDGSRRDALVRVLLGIALDGGFSGDNNEQAIRKEYGLDDYSVVEMLPFDVACSDTRAKQKGMSAPALVAERLEACGIRQEKSPAADWSAHGGKIENSLQAVNYCAGFYRELGNIYGQISDAVYAKPYQLGWGKQPARFIEAEERRAYEEAQSAQPRPWLWIPDRFNRSGRYMASGELELLAWLMLERGSKGIRYHYWNKPVAEIMADHPWLMAVLPRINKDISQHKDVLAPLIPVSEWTLEKEKFKVYESWSGDQGILIFVRNLDYRTETGSKGEEPKFNVVPKQNVNVIVRLPVWFKGKKAVDLFSRNSLPAEKQKDVMQVNLDRLEAFRLIWLE